MGKITNKLRAYWGARALSAAVEMRESGNELCNTEEVLVVDLLANLRHFCARERIDFNKCLLIAEIHAQHESTRIKPLPVVELAEVLAAIETASEFAERTDECISGDDARAVISRCIVEARIALGRDPDA